MAQEDLQRLEDIVDTIRRNSFPYSNVLSHRDSLTQIGGLSIEALQIINRLKNETNDPA